MYATLPKATSLEVMLGKLLKDNGFTISCAESCTGGMLTSRLTDVPGSSAYVKGSIVSYSNEIKKSLLNVSADMLENFSDVSEETTLEMAINVRKIFDTTVGVGITGIAGPTGSTEDKPVGLVYVAISGVNGEQVETLHLNGNRVEIKWRAAESALMLIYDYLKPVN